MQHHLNREKTFIKFQCPFLIKKKKILSKLGIKEKFHNPRNNTSKKLQ